MRYMIGFAVGCALIASSSAAFAQSISNSTSAVNSTSAAQIISNAPSRTRGRIDTTVSSFAPGLAAAGLNSCAGSSSVGASGTGFSFGFGGTYEMEECTRRQNAASLAGLGQNLAALEMLCQSPAMKNALNMSGTLCPSQRYQYEQAEANRRGTFYAPAAAQPVVYRRTRNGRRVRAAIAAQVSGSDASIQQASVAGRYR